MSNNSFTNSEKQPEDFNIQSYELHESYLKKYVIDCEKSRTQTQSWWREDTIDAWRHLRMRSSIDPLLFSFPDAYWLTVGDGYGTDAHYIEKKGVKALATDISDALLIQAKHDGLIEKYQKENAEFLSFKDKTFDFVLCKESFHHYPRPTIALYEMLRVAKKGVILIEPQDKITDSLGINLIEKLKFFVKKQMMKSISSRTIYKNEFEEVGNYVYTVSEREVEKLALGLGLNLVAFKGINDFYIKGFEEEKAEPTSKLFKKVKLKIEYKDLLCKLKLRLYEGLVVIIFKELPDVSLRNRLREHDYKLINLPQNPYI